MSYQFELPFPDKFKTGDKVIVTSGKYQFLDCTILKRASVPRKYAVEVRFGKTPTRMIFHENNIELCSNV